MATVMIKMMIMNMATALTYRVLAMRQALCLFKPCCSLWEGTTHPFYRPEHWDLERLSNLIRTAKVVSVRSQNWNRDMFKAKVMIPKNKTKQENQTCGYWLNTYEINRLNGNGHILKSCQTLIFRLTRKSSKRHLLSPYSGWATVVSFLPSVLSCIPLSASYLCNMQF